MDEEENSRQLPLNKSINITKEMPLTGIDLRFSLLSSKLLNYEN